LKALELQNILSLSLNRLSLQNGAFQGTVNPTTDALATLALLRPPSHLSEKEKQSINHPLRRALRETTPTIRWTLMTCPRMRRRGIGR
jgi:hypothetical protein